MKGVRHVPYEAALQRLRLFFLTHRQIRTDNIYSFTINNGLLGFLKQSTLYPRPTKAYVAMILGSNISGCYTRRRQHTFNQGLLHKTVNKEKELDKDIK